jgi:hypothetical protein
MSKRSGPLPRFIPSAGGRAPYVIDHGWDTVLLEMAGDLTAEEWAIRIGCCVATVCRAVNRLGVATRDMPATQARWAEKMALHRKYSTPAHLRF